MMDGFESYWQDLLTANPKLGSCQGIELSLELFRQSLCRAYDAGHAEGWSLRIKSLSTRFSESPDLERNDNER